MYGREMLVHYCDILPSHQLELVLISYCVALQCEAVFFIPKHQTNHKRGEVGES